MLQASQALDWLKALVKIVISTGSIQTCDDPFNTFEVDHSSHSATSWIISVQVWYYLQRGKTNWYWARSVNFVPRRAALSRNVSCIKSTWKSLPSPFSWITLLRQSSTRDELVTSAADRRRLKTPALLWMYEHHSTTHARYLLSVFYSATTDCCRETFKTLPLIFVCRFFPRPFLCKNNSFVFFLFVSHFVACLEQGDAGRLHRDKHAQLSSQHHCLFFVLQ